MSISVSRQALSRLGRSLVFRLFLVALTLYTLYHCVSAFSDRVTTDVVTQATEYTTVSGEAVLFRDETVVTVSGGPYLCSYPHENGAKVNARATLAQLFATAGEANELANRQAALNALDRQLALLESTALTDTLAALPSLRADASKALLSSARHVTGNAPMSELSDDAFALLRTLHRITALTGEGGTAATPTATLMAERQRLLMSTGHSSRTVTVADVSTDASGGYFYYGTRVDGYEDIFRRSALASMTLSELDALLATPARDYGTGVSVTVVGKLARTHVWSIAVSLDPDVALTLEVGQRYPVTFTDEYELSLNMTLDRTIGSRAEGRIVAVLSCTELPRDFTFTRFSNVTLTLDATSGYRIPETALTEVDGVTGVYILEDGRVCFRTVDILLRGEGYALVYAPTKQQREDEADDTYHAHRYVSLRDIVITEGDDLYDGKYID